VAVRGADAASSGGNTYGLRISLFPKRVGLDVEVFKALTHPDVQRRGWPSSLDVMAALGVPAARQHALAAATAEELHDAYRAALDKLAATSGGQLRALAATDLYHSWLAMLATLAVSAPRDAPDAARRMPFLRDDAWLDRLLHASLAGYTQLKHAAVLYAFQDYSAECDSATAYQVLVEQPILPEPRGFVDPAPEFFGAMAKLAGLVHQRLAGGEPLATESSLYDADGKELADPKNAKGFAEMLGALAAKEVRGEALTSEDYRWINYVGAVMEALFLGQPKPSAMGYGADEGRLERGVALVTDVHTNVTSSQVLELGIGRLLDLYVVVGDAVGQRMTQGAALSFFEFRHPMADRLSDEQWGAMVKDGQLPAPPPWTSSFLEPAPK
jgi:hypothetical protein